jgi:lysozyme family protein
VSDPNAAIEFVLRQEDSTLSGIITNESGDAGGLTRFGLCAKWHPELVSAGFYDVTMDTATALPLAKTAYQTAYATSLRLAQINAQTVANALLSFAVNLGTFEAVETLQQVCGAVADGCMGPNTVAAVNKQDPATLLAAYCAIQANHYRGIVAANPTQAKFLQGWLNRVNAVAAQFKGQTEEQDAS